MTIPKRLVRSVPAEVNDQAEAWWATAQELHPGWEAITYRDPIDPEAFPNTAALWSRCSSGAQRAGLVRLEALWEHGGIWVDQDLELLQPLDALLAPAWWGCWEDEQTVPDFVFGCEARHPVTGALMQAAIESVRHGDGPWASGPGVFTRLLPGRPDVLLLAPGSFAPIHYQGKAEADWSSLRARFPYAYGVHHWWGSWLT